MNHESRPAAADDTVTYLPPVEPAEQETVDGGFYFKPYTPIGNRADVGCGTMVLIDRMFPIVQR
ncbi:MAG TPA: hypothetical protein PKC18_08230 [Lacipirellulaceae bacterium]|nr:hypothetical protein [Lacipirellulaceae bacterium]HMP07793.1 hypothetical protein [Lacipirellulaceae bacterium]